MIRNLVFGGTQADSLTYYLMNQKKFLNISDEPQFPFL